jgi:hypothetical protein
MRLNPKHVLLFVAGLILCWGLAFVAAKWAREVTLTTYGTAAASDEWESWRTQAALQNEAAGPVKRHVPNSAEPPALILMRDYFPTMVVTSLVCGTLVYCFCVAMLVLLLQRRARPTATPSDSPPL